MFGTVVEKIQTLLSRSFLLGNFFPVLCFAVINLAIAWLAIEGFADFVGTKWLSDATTFSTVSALALVALAIVAFVFAPLIPLIRQILEGRIILPRSLRDKWIRDFTAQWQELETHLKTASADYAFFDLAVRDAAVRFEIRTKPGDRTNLDPTALNAAKDAFAALKADLAAREQETVSRERLPAQDKVLDAIKRLESGLGQYPMQADPTNPVPGIAKELDAMQGALTRILHNAKTFAYRLLQAAESNSRTNFAPHDIRATRIGNSRAAMERYPAVAYDVDYEFLWPRLRLVLSKEKTVADAVETATAHLDFSVLMTALLAITTMIWIPVLSFAGNSLLMFSLIGLLLPALTLFFYQLVHETQKAFGSVMEMAIDALRLDLLKALRQPLPISLGAEQKTWKDLQIALYSGLDQIRYRHPKS